ncbi:thiamine pyrophosphokinase, variant 2 [Balamuthia mandrillaris]
MRRTYGVLSSVALNQRERLCGLDPRTTSFVLFVTAAQRLPTRHYTKATSSTSTQTTTTTWDCCPFFPRVEGKAREEDERTNGEKCLVGGGETSAVVVVDRPLYPDRPNYAHYLTIFSNLWHNAQLRVCADGGANRVHALSKESYVPDFIIGDLDSARDDVLDYYTNTKGTQLLRVAEQETTDLDKCIRTIWELENKRSVHYKYIYIFGGFGGNFTQELSNLNVLYKYSPRKLILVSPLNVGFVLHPGRHVIVVPPTEVMESTKPIQCGLLPIGGSCVGITTSGLRWNLGDNTELRFGGLISTSNEIADRDGRVVVNTPNNVFWTLDFRKYLAITP